jgi:Fe-S-cluster containining protein
MNQPPVGKLTKDKTLTFDRYTRFFEELAALYSAMDSAYNQAADYYGFFCAGCTDNCCLTRFYHHTHMEELYLLNGFFKLGLELQASIRDRAQMVNRKVMKSESHGKVPRVMCALNEQGACLLYAHRPMICRLHGIPHEIRTHGKQPVFGPGCEEFVQHCGDKVYKTFDRTPFYLSLADLEQRFKQKSGFSGKFKKTISEFFL